MRKITGFSLFLMTTISVVGCAGMLSVPDEHTLVSNYHIERNTAESRPCDFRASRSDSGEKNQQPGLNPEAIRLLNWNVYKGTSEDWPVDFKRLSRDSDIVALQEAQLHTEFKNGLEQRPLHWDLTTAFTYGGAETGVLLASKVKPVALCALRANEPVISIPKSALVTEYPVQGTQQTLMVANIHMINFSFGTDAYSEQLSQLKQVLLQHEGALVVTGDFNTWSDARLSVLHDLVSELKLTAAEYEEDFRMTVFGSALDHVYYRGLEASKVSMEQVDSSDHNPMTVTFKLAGL